MQAWYLLTTKLKSEHRAQENLQLLHGLEAFFPCYPARKTGSPAGLALFPRYIFARFDLERDYERVRCTPGVSRIVTFGSAPQVVPEEVINCLRLSCDRSGVIQPPELSCGQEVLITRGVFRGCQGIISEKRDNHRINLLLDLISGRTVEVEIDARLVQAIA